MTLTISLSNLNINCILIAAGAFCLGSRTGKEAGKTREAVRGRDDGVRGDGGEVWVGEEGLRIVPGRRSGGRRLSTVHDPKQPTGRGQNHRRSSPHGHALQAQGAAAVSG